MLRSTVFIVAVCCCSSWAMVPPTRKIWVQQRTDNFQNWFTRLRIGDINFPTNLESAMAFPSGDDESCEIIFPLDDLASDDDLLPVVPGQRCPNNARQTMDARSFWINPDNWKLPINSLMSSAIPHMERIPCVFDDVEFPDTKDLLVVMPNQNLTVKSIAYGPYTISSSNSWYSRSIWERLQQHLVVKGEADVSRLLKFSRRKCSDLSGCVCGTWPLFDDICAVVQPNCPTNLKCASPFKPFGHCCDICGFYMELLIDQPKFVFEKLKLALTSWMTATALKIHYHMSKKSNDTVHIIITVDDDENRQDVVDFVKDIRKKIKTSKLKNWVNLLYTF